MCSGQRQWLERESKEDTEGIEKGIPRREEGKRHPSEVKCHPFILQTFTVFLGLNECFDYVCRSFLNDVCILFISSYDPRHVIFIFSPSSPFDSHSNYWSIISSLDEEDSSMSYVERSEAARGEEDDLKKLFLQHRNHIYIRSHIHSHIHRRESYKREHVNTHITLLVFEEKRSRAEEPFDSFCGVKEEVSYNSRFMYKKVLSNFLMTGLSLIPA